MKTKLSKIALFSLVFLMLPIQSSYAGDTVYGWQLMTQQERMEHRNTMQQLSTNEERERYLIQHRINMQERAKQQGLTLPDMPMGRGFDNGSGDHGGMGGQGGSGGMGGNGGMGN